MYGTGETFLPPVPITKPADRTLHLWRFPHPKGIPTLEQGREAAYLSFNYYWTWKRLGVLVRSLANGRTLTRGEWQALHREIPFLSSSKKIWLYRQLRQYYPADGMKYLFHGWKPNSSPTELSPWL
jgi:hypothetical protein